MAVYFLRYDEPAGDPHRPRAHASLYVGWAEDERVPARIDLHRTGRSGAALPGWFHEQGIKFRVVRILWGATREDERRIKRAGHYYRWLPRPGRAPYRPRWWRRRQSIIDGGVS